MKKIFLMGRSEAGKTSLTQALKGEELHYIKTQYTNTADDTIDSPGEYAESKRFSVGLACFSFEADVVAMVQAADEPFNVTREGVDELMEYLKDDLPHLTIEQAKFKQSLGINEWDPLPEGVDYPEEIRTAAE